MDRRKFLASLIGGVAATAAVRTFPFRVFSFPSKIAEPQFFIPVEVARSLGTTGIYFYNSATGLLTRPTPVQLARLEMGDRDMGRGTEILAAAEIASWAQTERFPYPAKLSTPQLLL